jgi:NAD(P)-dependent dehydrogenase (short-subunit alcohol dehydrogenase family)
MRISDKVAIVTGGGSGIGRAVCQLFAAEGASVLATDIDDRTGKETARLITNQGGKAKFVKADMAKESDCRMVVNQCAETFGRINILVNSAARFIMKGLEATPEDWKQVMETNVFGYAYMMRLAAERMKAAGGGSIVNVASISSVVAQPQMVTYNTSKGAVLQLTRCAAMDLAPDNIRVNCVCPGLVWTPVAQRRATEAGLTREQATAAWAGMQFIKRAAEPSEIGYAILFLASDESSFCTGSALFVDGGHTTQ